MFAKLRRPASVFGDNNARWYEYLQYKPSTRSQMNHFVAAVRNAKVHKSDPWLLLENGELVRKSDQTPFMDVPSDPKTIRIDPIYFNPKDSEGIVDDPTDDVARVTYMIRLPQPIPDTLRGNLAPDTLFVTRDHLGIFAHLRQLNGSILTGNPGIGKSWYLWEYLVYLLNPAVYESLTGSIGLPVHVKGSQDAERVVLMYFSGESRTEVLFLDESPVVCHTIFDAHTSSLCETLKCPTGLMLFEPAGSNEAVDGGDIRTIASLPPDKVRYSYFQKHRGVRCFMPCPTRDELLAACAYVRPRARGTPLQELYTHEQCVRRIEELGPFTRYVLPLSEGVVDDAYADRKRAVDALTSEGLLSLICLHTIEKSGRSQPVNHWFLRYDVDRTHEWAYSWGSARLLSASRWTLEMVRSRHLEIDFDQKIQELMKFDNSGGKHGDQDFCRLWFQDVFAENGMLGLKWASLRSERLAYDAFTIQNHMLPQAGSIKRLKVSENEEETSVDVVDGFEEINFRDIQYDDFVPYGSMKDNTLYVNTSQSVPFIDGVWKCNGRLYAFVVVTGSSHPQGAARLNSALEQL